MGSWAPERLWEGAWLALQRALWPAAGPFWAALSPGQPPTDISQGERHPAADGSRGPCRAHVEQRGDRLEPQAVDLELVTQLTRPQESRVYDGDKPSTQGCHGAE